MIEFIADLAGNHNGDLERARKLIRETARVGGAGVVLPFLRVESVFAPAILRVSPAHRLYRRRELPHHFLPHLAACAQREQVKFGLAPGDFTALEQAAEHADFLVVTSHDLPWLDLVLRCAETGLPLQLHTGMAEAGEVWNAIETALEAGCTDLTLLHEVARFPTPAEACNLAAIGTLRELLVREFAPLYPEARLKAGWSDHAGHPGVIARAVNHWGCDTVVFAFDLEGQGQDYHAGHCWLPDRAADIIAGGFLPVRRECDGNGRLAPDPGEMEERGWRTDPADGLRPTRAVRRTWPASQPESMHAGPEVYMVADGGGLAHFSRCLALAEALRDDHDADVVFLVRDLPWQMRQLVRHGFAAAAFDEVGDVPNQVGFLKDTAPDGRPPICVLDVQQPADGLAMALQAIGALTVVLGQPDCNGMDLGLVPFFGWRDDRGRRHLVGGSEYLLIREDIAAWRHGRAGNGGAFPRVLVSFGGADPDDLVVRVVRALHEVVPRGRVQVVRQPVEPSPGLVAFDIEVNHPEYEFIAGGDGFESLLAEADLLITGMGVTVAEALCLGVPCLILSGSTADAAEVERLVAGGAVLELGRHRELTDGELAARLRAILGDGDVLSRLRFHARELAAAPIDGHGASRAADRIVELLQRHGDRTT